MKSMLKLWVATGIQGYIAVGHSESQDTDLNTYDFQPCPEVNTLINE